MDFSEIKFCNKIAFNITNNRQKSDIIKNIYTKYNIELTKKNFKFYSNKFINNLKDIEHFINLVTQGNEYWLYLTTINNENYSLFIDKNIQKGHTLPKIIISYFRFSPELYKNDTLFNGELIRSYSGDWEFLIDDLYIYKGKKLFNKCYIDRIKELYYILNNNYILDNYIQICSIKVKKLFTKKDLLFIKKTFIPKCNYKIIGMNFISSINNQNIRFYFNLSQINNRKNIMKFLENNDSLQDIMNEQEKILNDEINNENKQNILGQINKKYRKYFKFLVKITKLPNIYKLYINKNDKITKYSIAKIDTLEKAEYMRTIFKHKKEYIMECYYYKDFLKWVPVTISKHKNISNYIDIINYII